MSEMMLFPKTWEEFEKYYGFYDIKQAYMYGNTRLIPSFRVQQWLNHIDDINRKKQSQKNKMKQVAAMFGKKLGEEFKVNEEECRKNLRCKITEKGLFFYHSNYEAWWQDSGLLSELITGEAVIVDEQSKA